MKVSLYKTVVKYVESVDSWFVECWYSPNRAYEMVFDTEEEARAWVAGLDS